MANGDPGSSSTLIFAFIVGFLGLSGIFITAGIMWPRFRVLLAERFGLFLIEEDVPAAVSKNPRPMLWEVYVRGRGGSECTWEHLRPLALRVGLDPASGGRSKGAKTEKSRSRRRPPFQTARSGDPEEGGQGEDEGEEGEELAGLEQHKGTVAVLIAMPSCPPWSPAPTAACRPSEYALGLAHVQVRWHGRFPRDGRDGPSPRRAQDEVHDRTSR